MKKIIKSVKFQLLFIIILTFLSFSNSLVNGFVWDDHLFIEKWKEIQTFENIPDLLGGLAPQEQGGVYRPLRSIFYVLDYGLWAQNPFFYHLQAILIHLGVTVLIYFIAKKIFSNLTIKQYNNDLPAFTTALLFGLHPIHTETIDYIAASMETWGSMFFFLSFYLYVRGIGEMKGIRRGKNWWYVGSLASALLAFFTYEMTLTLPILIALYEFLFRTHARRPLAKLKAWIWALPYFGLSFFYVFVRIFILGIVARTDYLAYSFYHTQLTMVKVFVRYIFLLIFPFNLTANHNLVGNFPSSMLPYDKLEPILSQSILDLDVLLGILGILGMLGLAIKLYRKFPIVTFCIGWFFISLLPVSYILPHGGAMAEKYLYIASFGFVLLLALVIEKFSILILQRTQNSKVKTQNYSSKLKTFGTMTLVISLFYFYLTFQRNTVWRNDITLFSDMARHSPYNLISNYTLGVLHAQKNDLNKAEDYYKRAIGTASDFWEARYNLGNIYLKLGRTDLAKKEYEKVLELNPDFMQARVNLEALPNIATSSSSTSSNLEKVAISPILIKEDQGLIKYSYRDIRFKYPKGWEVEELDRGVRIENAARNFVVEMKLDKKSEAISTNEYVSRDKENYGLLAQEGLARIPGMDWAYVKIWQSKLQFFLFKGEQVIKILVYPSDSSEMKQFDTILGSISLNETK